MGLIGLAAGAAVASKAFRSKKPPPVITQANNPIANKIKPINFVSIFDELSKDKLDIIKGLDGKLSIKFSNDNERVNLAAGNQEAAGSKLHKINNKASGVVALSQAITKLANTIEEMENTSLYLIEQNKELIDSFRIASINALDRGFNFRQNSIDQKLTRMGLADSSSAFGVQVALAREKAHAYAEMELKQAQLAQNLKQQSIANLQQRSEILGKNAAIALNDKALNEQRRSRMTEMGVNMFNQPNQQAIMAQHTDNNNIAQQNQAQYMKFRLTPENPWKAMGRTAVGNLIGYAAGGLTQQKTGPIPIDESRGIPWRNYQPWRT